MHIIGLTGRKRSGKDTVARFIMDMVPDSERLAFADPLKEEVAAACGVSVAYIEAHKENFRLILQGWGTDFRRELSDPEHWIKQMRREIAIAVACDTPLAVVTDVRFPDEAEALRRLGAVIIRVVRPATRNGDHHPSETNTDEMEVDAEILNDSGLEELQEVTQVCFSQLIDT